MAKFSPKARRFIETAVQTFSDGTQREIWTTWARLHPEVRQADDDLSNSEVLPRAVVITALGALESMASDLRRDLNSGFVNEDDAYDLENDLSFIDTLESMLIRDLKTSTVNA